MKVTRNGKIIRLLSFFLCLITVFTLASCGGEKNVKISIPDIFLNNTERSDLASYCKVNDFLSAEYDEGKGKIKITMTQIRYENLLVKLGLSTMTSIANMIKSDTFPYFTEIGEYSEDFSEIEIKVNGKEYRQDSTASLLPLSVSEACLMYLAYTTQKNPKCKVTVTDNETGEILYSETHDMA